MIHADQIAESPERGADDALLVDRAKRGDADAFGALVHRHQASLLALGVSLVGDWAEAEDLVQEAFLRAFRNLDLLMDDGRFAPWIRRVMFGTCVDFARAFRRQLYQSGSSDEDGGGVPTDDPSPLDRVEERDLVDRVTHALQELPPLYRTPLTMYHIDGLSHEKVARTLNVPVGTVRSLVSRARRRLAKSLAPLMLDTLADEAGDVLGSTPHSPNFLHVLNGESTLSTIERSEVPGDFMVWSDVLHEGPVPGGLEDEEFLAVRAHFIASLGWATYQEAVEVQRQWADTLSSFRDYDELVLWFEHDLFDQLLLVRHLDWYGRQSHKSTPLSLICIGEFPGVPRFDGLGQLNADQLASLLGTRQHVSLRQIELARSAWRAFRSDSPIPLLRFVERDTSALPFLGAALQRFLEEYPDSDSGLPRTERQILEALVSGPKTPRSLFAESRQGEESVFMGDGTFWARVQTLASGPAPLLQLETARARDRLPDGEVSLTPDGLRVLAGEADWIDLNGIDRWLGGVHLHTHAPWRWDRERRTIVRSRA